MDLYPIQEDIRIPSYFVNAKENRDKSKSYLSLDSNTDST